MTAVTTVTAPALATAPSNRPGFGAPASRFARFLAVGQLGLTFIGFLASAFAAISLSQGLSRALVSAGLDAGTADGVSLVVVTVILALFTIVFAELVPKSLALAHPERFAVVLSGPLDLLGRDHRDGRR